MRVLLPPSETKRPDGGNAVFREELLTDHPARVRDAHRRVRCALTRLSRDEDAAVAALKLGRRNRGDVRFNLSILGAPALPALERYTGVLYDAIAPMTLSETERRWLGKHVAIQSALFGLISAETPIPPYRLSATSRLPQLGATLRSVWSEAYAAHDWGEILTLDLRSKDYAALAPIPTNGRCWFVEVAERSDRGIIRPLNHFNKRAKGLFVRDLARSLANGEATPTTVDDLVEWGHRHAWDLLAGEGQLTLLQRVR